MPSPRLASANRELKEEERKGARPNHQADKHQHSDPALAQRRSNYYGKANRAGNTKSVEGRSRHTLFRFYIDWTANADKNQGENDEDQALYCINWVGLGGYLGDVADSEHKGEESQEEACDNYGHNKAKTLAGGELDASISGDTGEGTSYDLHPCCRRHRAISYRTCMCDRARDGITCSRRSRHGSRLRGGRSI